MEGDAGVAAPGGSGSGGEVGLLQNRVVAAVVDERRTRGDRPPAAGTGSRAARLLRTGWPVLRRVKEPGRVREGVTDPRAQQRDLGMVRGMIGEVELRRIRRRHGLAPRRNPAALRELVVAAMPQVVGRRPSPAPPQQGRQLGMYLVTGNDEANGALIVNPTGPVRPPRRGGRRGCGHPRRPLGRTGGRVRPAGRRAHLRPGGPVQLCPGPPGPLQDARSWAVAERFPLTGSGKI